MLSLWVAAAPLSTQVFEQARKIAPASSTVLIRGESGTGKNLLASMIHALGPRPDEPLMRIECAGLPAELVEAQLFGEELGAGSARRGFLEIAAAGSVVLDQIGALPMATQAKLLRVIEEKRFQRPGSSRPIDVNARVVALTSIDLERAVTRRTFREDLYYRLNVVPLVLPPLRERRADIRPLAEHFATQLSDMHRKPHVSPSSKATAALEQYSFPGNVRELRSLIEYAVIHGSSPEILMEDLPAHVRSNGSGGGTKVSLEELERAYIAEVLDFTQGKKSKAAAILGISRKTLLEKRKRYGMQ
ncbi:MAG: sigma-54-dependent Fis family transcriptional regulator [Acidobacteriaceae bacterium]|nr:sigma-54-dependent Fis family transcriptional regulator [Acidobacteriaceae bacterium]